LQLIAAPMLGRWSDRYGRRRLLLLTQLGTFLSWLIFLAAVTLPQQPLLTVDSRLAGAFTLTVPLVALFLARALDGFTGGNVSIANAYLADISEDRSRSANFGRMAVASNLGFVFGPALSGLLAATGMDEVGMVVAALLISAVACVIVAFGLPDSTPCVLSQDPEHLTVRKLFGQEQGDCFNTLATGKLSLVDALKLPAMKLILAVYFLVFLAFNLFYVGFPVYAATGIHWSLAQIGVYFAAMGLMMALVQGPLLNRLSRRWSERQLAIGGSLPLALSFACFMSSSAAVIYFGTALLALGNGVMWPSLLAMLSRTTDRSAQGAVQGFASSAGAIASIAGLLIGGALYRSLGTKIFLISVLLVVLSGALCLLLPSSNKKAAA
jgi:DHA1 family tetracycline resistance protein-like MFS transporter